MLCYKHASIIVTLKYYRRCLPQITQIDCHQQKPAIAITTTDITI